MKLSRAVFWLHAVVVTCLYAGIVLVPFGVYDFLADSTISPIRRMAGGFLAMGVATLMANHIFSRNSFCLLTELENWLRIREGCAGKYGAFKPRLFKEIVGWKKKLLP